MSFKINIKNFVLFFGKLFIKKITFRKLMIFSSGYKETGIKKILVVKSCSKNILVVNSCCKDILVVRCII